VSDYRRYWQRHPFQRRATAVLLLVLSPVLMLPFLLVVYWHEIIEAAAAAFSGLWQVVIESKEQS